MVRYRKRRIGIFLQKLVFFTVASSEGGLIASKIAYIASVYTLLSFVEKSICNSKALCIQIFGLTEKMTGYIFYSLLRARLLYIFRFSI